MKLNNIQVKNAKPKDQRYKICDGNNLYLSVAPTGRKSWYVVYRIDGKRNQIIVGKYPLLSLAEARDRSFDVAKLVMDGIDPMKHREQKKLDRILSTENNFELLAREWHNNKKHSWTDVHEKNILVRLEKYIFPLLGNRPINEIKPLELLHTLRQIENDGKHELTHRMLQICSQICVHGSCRDT